MKTYIRFKNIYFWEVLSSMKNGISLYLVSEMILHSNLAAILDFEPFHNE